MSPDRTELIDALEAAFREHYPQEPAQLDTSRSSETLYDILKSDASAGKFLALVDKCPRVKALLQDPDTGEHTVFLPLDSSWNGAASESRDVKETIFDRAITDEVFGEQLLSMHISPHYVTTDTLLDQRNVPNILRLQGSNGPQIIRTRCVHRKWQVSAEGHITEANIIAADGVIHKIDDLLTPPTDLLQTLSRDDLSLFRKAIKVAGLEEEFASPTMQGRTVFAPTNDAIHNLGDDSLAKLLMCPQQGNAALRDLLRMHFTPSTTIFSNFIWPKNDTGARLRPGDTMPLLKGARTFPVPTMLHGNEGRNGEGHGKAVDIGVMFARYRASVAVEANGSLVVVQDVSAREGTVQIIDGVLRPPPSI